MADQESRIAGHDEGIVESSGLFDREWYLSNYPDVAATGEDLLTHFCQQGWEEGRCPNAYFDPAWYSETYGEEIAPNENPLLHYIREGERENAWPSENFDPEWYRQEYAIGEHQSPLRHYLENRTSGKVSPLPTFDAFEYVAENPECAGEDAFQHWLQHHGEPAAHAPEVTFAKVLDLVNGNHAEEIIPDTVSWDAFTEVLRLFVPLLPFDEEFYCAEYPDIAEALERGDIESAHQHFIDQGFFEGRTPVPPTSEP